ncbi:MAG: hypothetical protein HQ546_10680 [Planctomycetes bacterium]|nr:hypothetical protein [Planctomycetota bacterium]
MGTERIVLTAPVNQSAMDRMREVVEVAVSPTPDETATMALFEGTVVGLVARGEGRVTKKMIDACADLRVIGRPGAGYDTVDLAEANRRKIPLVYAPVGAFAVAEGALAMLMTLVKKVHICDPIVKSGQWFKRYDFFTGDMADHTLGIVGLGRIGSYLAKLVQPFDMTILGHDPAVSAEDAVEMGVEFSDLDDLLGRSDYVSVHMPLLDATRGIINRQWLGKMKKGAILVNTSRGGTMESLDVIEEALQSGQLSSAALDVFPVEPPDVSHPIFKNPNCLCVPHMIGVSEIAMERISMTMANGMIDVLQGRRPKYCVNPEVFE